MSSAKDHRSPGRRATPALVVGALGVVFGDIGTSPLYSVQAAFAIEHGAVQVRAESVLGVASLILWSVLVVVTIKYVGLVMRADNDGEGGVIALAMLARRAVSASGRARTVVVMLGIVAAALFYGDSVITPAMSVLSAVEGLEVSHPDLGRWSVWICAVILILLFLVQRRGTHTIGRAFGPVMVVWFVTAGVLGIPQIVQRPEVLTALSPTRALAFVVAEPGVAFVAMGAVVLAITGAEALYADMGHFGRPAIVRAWLWLVFPCLVVNYLGQGALLLREPDAAANPFFSLAPEGLQFPLVVLATAATVIASQSVISGAFSMTRQAMRAGFFPRVTVRHTSAQESGQIYIPAVNWILLVGVLVLVFGFGSSARLSAAYGLAVTGTFVLTTCLLLTVARKMWGWSLPAVIATGVGFGIFELSFLAANLLKIGSGGWLPLGIATVLVIVMTTWRAGRVLVGRQQLRHDLAPLEARRDRDAHRTIVFLHATPFGTARTLRTYTELTGELPERALVLSVLPADVPHVRHADRLETVEKDGEVMVARATLGFMDHEDVPALARAAAERIGWTGYDESTVRYVAGRLVYRVTPDKGLARWRKHLFVALTNVAQSPITAFQLPVERTTILGTPTRL